MISTHDLLMQFESLGDNCEFGLVQRQFGAEPLGLFRFANVYTYHLADSICTDLLEFLDPDKVELDFAGEWYVTVPSLGYRSHTNMHEDVSPPDAKRKAMVHLAFLRRMMLDRLAEGDKLFVHKSREGTYHYPVLMYLHGLLQAFPKARLLTIFIADDLHPPGTVVRRDDGLYVGYIDRLSSAAWPHEISFNHWLTICQKAHRMWKADIAA